MRVLVVGGGGREHALVWRLRQGRRLERLWCAPGNAGIAALAECVTIAPDDVKALVRFAREQAVDLTVVGPELPLTLGLVDRLADAGLRAFGPSAAAARLEGSKAFTKGLLARENVPTAAFGTFTDPDAALRWVRDVGPPLVVKADGLASGKGVFICPTVEEARAAIDDVMRRRVFGEAGGRVVVEEFLEGEELSFMALADGTTVLPLASSQDHKRAFDGDEGPNTGGMGAYSPAPVLTTDLEARVMAEVMEPVVRAMARAGTPYTGVLYAGLMVKDGAAKVLEFNVRFGDPEAQVVLARLESDLVTVMERTCAGELAGLRLEWDPRPAVCVVLVAEGYPGPVEKGRPIEGLEALAGWRDGVVFHAGTRAGADGRPCTDGGRVLGVTALGKTIDAAVAHAYEAAARIHWHGMRYRRDIGRRALGGR
jgi:phosphoribosylamine--glycine ligase